HLSPLYTRRVPNSVMSNNIFIFNNLLHSRRRKHRPVPSRFFPKWELTTPSRPCKPIVFSYKSTNSHFGTAFLGSHFGTRSASPAREPYNSLYARQYTVFPARRPVWTNPVERVRGRSWDSDRGRFRARLSRQHP